MMRLMIKEMQQQLGKSFARCYPFRSRIRQYVLQIFFRHSRDPVFYDAIEPLSVCKKRRKLGKQHLVKRYGKPGSAATERAQRNLQDERQNVAAIAYRPQQYG